MFRNSTLFFASFLLASCGGEPSSTAPSETGATTKRAERMSEIANRPDPCSILTPHAAQAELGVRQLADIEPAPTNGDPDDGAGPWACSYKSGDASIEMTVDWSRILTSQGGAAVASAYSKETGDAYEQYGVAGPVRVRSHDDSETHIVYWSGLARPGDQSQELVIRASVDDPGKSADERAEIADALADMYFLVAVQAAMVDG